MQAPHGTARQGRAALVGFWADKPSWCWFVVRGRHCWVADKPWLKPTDEQTGYSKCWNGKQTNTGVFGTFTGFCFAWPCDPTRKWIEQVVWILRLPVSVSALAKKFLAASREPTRLSRSGKLSCGLRLRKSPSRGEARGTCNTP